MNPIQVAAFLSLVISEYEDDEIESFSLLAPLPGHVFLLYYLR